MILETTIRFLPEISTVSSKGFHWSGVKWNTWFLHHIKMLCIQYVYSTKASVHWNYNACSKNMNLGFSVEFKTLQSYWSVKSVQNGQCSFCVCVYYVAINIIVNVSLVDMIQLLTDSFPDAKRSYFYETVPFQVFLYA